MYTGKYLGGEVYLYVLDSPPYRACSVVVPASDAHALSVLLLSPKFTFNSVIARHSRATANRGVH